MYNYTINTSHDKTGVKLAVYKCRESPGPLYRGNVLPEKVYDLHTLRLFDFVNWSNITEVGWGFIVLINRERLITFTIPTSSLPRGMDVVNFLTMRQMRWIVRANE